MKKYFLLAALLAVAIFPANAALVQLNLLGTAGAGLLPGNEPVAPSGGTGGEIGAGIFFDDVANVLTLNVGWGSSQGFVNLSSTANNSHIHGPTAANNGNNFTQTAGVLFNLTRSSSAVTGGTFSPNTVTLTAAQATDLLNGKYYINVHTANNGGGEMRGFLIPGYTLTVTTNGTGSISPSGGDFNAGSNVVLTATPGFSYAFTGWSGAVSGTNNPITVAMTANKSVTGNFTFTTNGVTAAIALAAQISWFAVTNIHYQVQAASVLNTNVWLDLGAQINGNNATNFYYEPFGTNQNRFFRVQTRP
jgi:CHRD domain/Divergent InlB B-repeat domain